MNTLERKKNHINSLTKRPAVNAKGLRRDNILLLEENNTRKTPIRKETRSTRAVLKSTTHKPKPVVKSAVETKPVIGRTRVFQPVVSADEAVDCKDDEPISDEVVVLHSIPSLNEEEEKDTGSGSDYDFVNDSTSSQGDYQTADDDEETGNFSGVSKKLVKKKHSRSHSHSRHERDKPAVPKINTHDFEESKSELKWSGSSIIPKVLIKFDDSAAVPVPVDESSKDSDIMSINADVFPSSEVSVQGPDGDDNLSAERTREDDTSDEALSNSQSTVMGFGEELDAKVREEDVDRDARAAASNEKIAQMEIRIEKLEDELRQVAAIETCVYSIVPQHGKSSYKVHTPARLLCRFYLHACGHWNQNKRASVARNTVSGLILVARTSRDDVSRLTYWLSNIVVLREMIQQQAVEVKGCRLLGERTASSKHSSGSANWQVMNDCIPQSVEDWQKTRTFTAALEKIESWIYLRIVDSVWKQTFSSYMHSPAGFRPAFGSEALEGSFSSNYWWQNAFRDALQRLCPVRASGSECGCLPVLARMTMEECIDRLDVSMFNAILRESAHQVPTDPISDPIADPKVLPIPAGELTFGSGAQLKNSVGNWCRWLSESLEMKTDHHHYQGGGFGRPICFPLLDELSDLLMTPKDMLIDHSIRREVCPSITLPLIKRVLCNFSPDEFCPDHVPGEVLETLNTEVNTERILLSPESDCSFPYTANPMTYKPPSSAYVAEIVADILKSPSPGSLKTMVPSQDDQLCDDYDDLVNHLGPSLLASVVGETFPCVAVDSVSSQSSRKSTRERGNYRLNMRHELLQEVSSVYNNNGL